jgi:hypothetical protein
MFNELSNLVEQKLQQADPQSVARATSDSVAQMQPNDVSQHVQTAASNLSSQGKPDLANELNDVVSAAQNDPSALRSAVVGFVKAHPESVAAFGNEFKSQIAQKL